MKKILSLVMILAMILSLAVPAMAADDDTYTLYIDIGQVVDSTKEVSGVWLYAYGGTTEVYNKQMTLVSGTVYSYSVPSDTVSGSVSVWYTDDTSFRASYTCPTESTGKNLYNPTAASTGTWSTYSAPIINGSEKGDVTASYTPVIKITDIVLSGYNGNGSVTVDAETKTYTINIPADTDSTLITVTVSGQNLDKLSEDYQFRIFEGFEVPFAPGFAEYDSNTGNVRFDAEVIKQQVGCSLQYTTDGGNTWADIGWSTVVRKEYSVTVNAAENGTVTANPATAAKGETVELFVTAAEGYELKALTVMQGENPVEVAADHTFVMPAGHVTVTATFQAAEKAYNITINESENGTVVAKVGEQQVTSAHHNDDVTLVATPAEGYQLSSLTVKDASDNEVTVTDSSTFVMPAGDVTVTATFKKVYTVVTDETFGNGTVTADKAFAAEGETVTLTFTPDDGYALYDKYAYDRYNADVTVELTAVTANTYTFTMPAHHVAVDGHFVKNGRARSDLYFNNGGNTEWTNVGAIFSTDTGYYVGSVNLVIAEDGIYTLPKGTEIPNLAYRVHFYDRSNYTVSTMIPIGEENMFTLGTTNEDNSYEGTWSVYTSSTPEGVTSADISWGSMSFTYDDTIEEGATAENGWTCEDGANQVTVTNNGTTAITASVGYTPETNYTEITGSFNDESEVLTEGENVSFTLTLSGKPKKALSATKIGTVTVTIEEANVGLRPTA